MEWWQALILGIVEGVTEYLPVSSTGHILLAQRAMGLAKSEASDAYAICIQAGAILAVGGLYWNRMKQMGRGLAGKDPIGWRLAINILMAFVVTGMIGVLLEKRVKAHLFHLPAITAAWMVGGLAILAMVYLRPKRRASMFSDEVGIEMLGPAQAMLIGLMQVVAIWPGVSRSLMTIVAGLLAGLSVGAAVEFAFLLGVVTLLAATGKDMYSHGRLMMETYSLGTMLLGMVAGGISAAVAVKWMVGYLRKHSLAVFGWYRVILAAVVGLLMAMGKLQ